MMESTIACGNMSIQLPWRGTLSFPLGHPGVTSRLSRGLSQAEHGTYESIASPLHGQSKRQKGVSPPLVRTLVLTKGLQLIPRPILLANWATLAAFWTV